MKNSTRSMRPRLLLAAGVALLAGLLLPNLSGSVEILHSELHPADQPTTLSCPAGEICVEDCFRLSDGTLEEGTGLLCCTTPDQIGIPNGQCRIAARLF